MEQTIGFIGVGNMGGAWRGRRRGQWIRGGLWSPTAAPRRPKPSPRRSRAGWPRATEVAESCDLVFLGVKPQMMAGLLADLQRALERRETPVTLVSMAAGVSMAQIRAMAGGDYPVIRIMPNTPVAVGRAWCSTIRRKMSVWRPRRSS